MLTLSVISSNYNHLIEHVMPMQLLGIYFLRWSKLNLWGGLGMGRDWQQN